ncbi:MAG: pseudouridine synthase [Solirubrobacterales bacterium]
MRLAKYLAHSGVASRRKSEKLIDAGRVAVGGRVVRDPARDVDESSGVEVDGRPVAPEPPEVWAVNKPIGVTSTAHEPGERTAIVELVDSARRLYPVGRLDVDSTGLILVTNDGELANRLMHPRYEVPRTYRATLVRTPSESDIKQLRAGLNLEDGPTAPAKVKRLQLRTIELTISEGRNRQVRRMFESLGHRLRSLERVRIGSLRLGRLGSGSARRLKPAEVDRLWKDSGHGDG